MDVKDRIIVKGNDPRLCAYCETVFVPKSPKKDRRFCSVSCAVRDPSRRRARDFGFQQGNPPWNKGLRYRNGPMTEERKRNISRARLASPGLRVTPELERLRKCAEYKQWREQVFKRDNWTCQECGARSAKGERIRIHADHIKPFATHPEFRFDVANGRTLCEPCHRATPTWGNGSRRQLTGKKAERIR